MSTTSIAWTDRVWNPVTGCTKVSEGCRNCYAEVIARRFWPEQYLHTIERGFISSRNYNGERCTGTPRKFSEVMCHEDRLTEPLRWRKPCRVFVNSMSDLFHPDVPDAFIDRVFAVMALSGYVLQVITDETWRSALVWMHLLGGGMFLVAYVGHLVVSLSLPHPPESNGNGNGNGVKS